MSAQIISFPSFATQANHDAASEAAHDAHGFAAAAEELRASLLAVRDASLAFCEAQTALAVRMRLVASDVRSLVRPAPVLRAVAS